MFPARPGGAVPLLFIILPTLFLFTPALWQMVPVHACNVAVRQQRDRWSLLPLCVGSLYFCGVPLLACARSSPSTGLSPSVGRVAWLPPFVGRHTASGCCCLARTCSHPLLHDPLGWVHVCRLSMGCESGFLGHSLHALVLGSCLLGPSGIRPDRLSGRGVLVALRLVPTGGVWLLCARALRCWEAAFGSVL